MQHPLVSMFPFSLALRTRFGSKQASGLFTLHDRCRTVHELRRVKVTAELYVLVWFPPGFNQGQIGLVASKLIRGNKGDQKKERYRRLVRNYGRITGQVDFLYSFYRVVRRLDMVLHGILRLRSH
jgi:hypothetical protein